MVQIRLAGEQDAAQIQAIYAPVVRDTVISFEMEIPTVGEMQERITSTLVHFPWLVCTQQETVLGYAYASQHRSRAAYQWSVDVSVYIHAQARRMGVGHGLYESLFMILALQGFFNAYAGIALPNPGSVGLHEAVGFLPVGVYHHVGYKFGAWHDVGWWHLALRPATTPPEPPLNLDAVCRSPEFETALAAGLPFLRV